MTALLILDPSDPTPLYAQLERAIRSAIASGRLAIGDQLPTVRRLAVDLRVNANTVAKVYAELERAGVLETRRGVGTFVRAHAPPSPPDRDARLRLLLDRLLAEAAALGYAADEVLDALDRFLRRDGVGGGAARKED
jgi:GntR family transcriptional regulator